MDYIIAHSLTLAFNTKVIEISNSLSLYFASIKIGFCISHSLPPPSVFHCGAAPLFLPVLQHGNIWLLRDEFEFWRDSMNGFVELPGDPLSWETSHQCAAFCHSVAWWDKRNLKIVADATALHHFWGKSRNDITYF